jgi:hypothetical protein
VYGPRARKASADGKHSKPKPAEQTRRPSPFRTAFFRQVFSYVAENEYRPSRDLIEKPRQGLIRAREKIKARAERLALMGDLKTSVVAG